jgi:hypothetical protein
VALCSAKKTAHFRHWSTGLVKQQVAHEFVPSKTAAVMHGTCVNAMHTEVCALPRPADPMLGFNSFWTAENRCLVPTIRSYCAPVVLAKKDKIQNDEDYDCS